VPPTKLLAPLALASLLLFACGDDDDAAGSDADTSEVDSGDDDESAAGDIAVEGEVGERAAITVPDGFDAPTELVIEDLVEGDGAEAPAGATVTVHYAGVLLDGTVFDSSFDRGQTATFALDGVIAGWTEGIPGMKVGGRRLLVIPSDLAYGETGTPGGPIGPNETLVFVVDLVDIG